MGSWISYTLVSGLILLCLYLAYSLAMAGDNQPRFNRAVIMFCYLLAAVLPLADLSPGAGQDAGAGGMAEAGLPVMAGIVIVDEEASVPLWTWILAGIYLAGVFMVTVMTVVAVVMLFRMTSAAEKIPYGKYMVAIIDDNSVAPFSWCRYIVMNRDDYCRYRDLILTHETAHLERYHRIDLLVARMFEIVMWYNPAAWLMTSSLRAVHEFEADRAVIDRIDNQRDYQMLLIKKAVGRSFPVLANSLNHSNLKKRITMMLNPVSCKSRRVRVLALVPAVAVALLSINLPFVARAIDSVSAIDLSVTAGDKDGSISDADKGMQNVVEPQTAVSGSRDETTGPAAPVGTTVTVNGKSDRNVIIFINGKESTRSLDTVNPDSIKSITVKKDPDQIHIEMYKPGETITIKPRPAGNALKDDKEVVVIGYGTFGKDDVQADKTVLSSVEEMPQFPGGDAALMKFLSENIRYPESELKNTGRHRVVVRFVVGADGSVRDAEILRGSTEAFNAEALRVVNMLPRYIPGKLNGKPVSVYYTLPVVFSSVKSGENTQSK